MSLTVSDIVFAAVTSLVLTWLIKSFVSIWRILKNPSTIEIAKYEKEITFILQKCYNLFPKDIVQFRGKTFKRGMKIRIITSQHKTIEGKLIGMNSQNILCIITKRYIIAHEISGIEDIINVEESKL